jgi:glycosyltransferase involved in cell wall biosynthesis
MKLGICSPFYPQLTALSRYAYDFVRFSKEYGFDPYLIPTTKQIAQYNGVRIATPSDVSLMVYSWGNNPLHHSMLHEFFKRTLTGETGVSIVNDPLMPYLVNRDCLVCQRLRALLLLSQAPRILKTRLKQGKWRLQWLEPYIVLKSCSAVVTSEYARSLLTGMNPDLTEDKIHTVRYPVDFEEYAHVQKEGARRLLGIPDHKVVFLCPGVISPHKGVEDTLYAIRVLREMYRIKNFVYILLGEEAAPHIYERSLLSYISSWRLNGHVKRVPFVSNQPGNNTFRVYLAASDFVFVPRRRTFGETSAVIPEAMAAGKVVIGADLGSAAEYLQGRGVLVPAGDPISIADSVVGLLNSDRERRALERRAKKFAETELDWKVIIRKLAPILEAARAS